jgi:Uma2 family endonuclease
MQRAALELGQMKAAETYPTPLKSAPLWPLPVAAYRALGEAGLIPKNTELLYGLVYKKSSKSPFHSFLVQFLCDLLLRAVTPGLVVRTEQPVTCGDSEPEPDLAVVQGRNENFRQDHPHTAELVIEVCITSHEYDRSKLPAYASAGVKECWLVLGPEKQIEVYRQPADGQFNERTVHGPGGKLTSTEIPAFTVDLSTLFAQ